MAIKTTDTGEAVQDQNATDNGESVQDQNAKVDIPPPTTIISSTSTQLPAGISGVGMSEHCNTEG